MSVQYDSSPRAVVDASNVTTTLGVASLGGTIGIRVIVDDAVLPSREAVLHHMEAVTNAIVKQTYPAS